MNLTRGNCAMTYQMPNAGHCAAHCTWWVHVHSHCHDVYAATCKSCHGDVPGFYWKGKCYYEYGRKQLSTSVWSWVGVTSGRNYYGCSTCFGCNIFGGYQNTYSRPLYYCVAKFHGWLIPGKLDQNTKTCWFRDTSTHCYYTLLAY